MEHALPLAGWENFYVIVGSSAAALTGLQFVVITLISAEEAPGPEVNVFGTPTVVHFCSVLIASAIFSAPWPDLGSASWALTVGSGVGVAYALNTFRRARHKMNYQPVMEDWIFHAFLPFIAYAAGFVASVRLPRHPAGSMFTIAAVSLLLLLVGIHNAWDSVVYVAIDRRRKRG
jgi:hypothetical protein